MVTDKKPTLAEIFLAAGKTGTPLNQTDNEGLTLAHKILLEASKKNNPGVIKLLLNAGADSAAALRIAVENPKNPEVEKDQKREDWLEAGMPLKKPMKIKNKPLTLNKRLGE